MINLCVLPQFHACNKELAYFMALWVTAALLRTTQLEAAMLESSLPVENYLGAFLYLRDFVEGKGQQMHLPDDHNETGKVFPTSPEAGKEQETFHPLTDLGHI